MNLNNLNAMYSSTAGVHRAAARAEVIDAEKVDERTAVQRQIAGFLGKGGGGREGSSQ
jgi:hypothetical protein